MFYCKNCVVNPGVLKTDLIYTFIISVKYINIILVSYQLSIFLILK